MNNNFFIYYDRGREVLQQEGRPRTDLGQQQQQWKWKIYIKLIQDAWRAQRKKQASSYTKNNNKNFSMLSLLFIWQREYRTTMDFT